MEKPCRQEVSKIRVGRSRPAGKNAGMNDYERIAKVIRYLDQNRTARPDLEALAEHAGLSKFHFHRLFSRWAGITPKGFLQCLTHAHARELLRQGESVLDTTFESAGSGSDGTLYGVKASQVITFRKDGEGPWSVVAWEQKSFRVLRAKQALFEEVLETALPDEVARELARRSTQEEVTTTALANERLDAKRRDALDEAELEAPQIADDSAVMRLQAEDRVADELPGAVIRYAAPTAGLEDFDAQASTLRLVDEDVLRVFVPGDGGARELFRLAAADRAQVRHLRPSVTTLEDVFAKAVGAD